MTWESTRSQGSASPLRPPTGRPRAFASGLRIRSPSPRSQFVASENDFDEVSCCDETYVSQLSTRSDAADHTFTERDRGFDHDMSPSRSILEKLKNDMNSLELLRQSEFFQDDSENRHYNGGRPCRDFSPPKQIQRPAPTFTRSRSVDVPRRDSDGGDSLASKQSPRLDRSWSTEKRKMELDRALGNDSEKKLAVKVKILEEENERLQTVASVLREDSVNDNRKLKEDLHEAKAHEVELKKELLKVTAEAEKSKKSLATATEQNESQSASLCEQLQSAAERERALRDKIGSLERAIGGEGGLELLLQESKSENKKLQETIRLMDGELDNLRTVIDKTKQENDEIKTSLKRAVQEKEQASSKLRDSERVQKETLQHQASTEKLLEEARNESIETKRALKDSLDEKHRLRSELSNAELAHCKTQEGKDVMEKLLKDEKEESHELKRDLQRATEENCTIKQLLSEEKNKAEKVRIGLENKFTHYENEINNLHIKSIEAEKITEEQLLKEREVYAYEKETIYITMRAMEKEKEECTNALQRLADELAKSSSHDVKATAALKISFDEHEKTMLELAKAKDEVKELTTKLSHKSGELIGCSRTLSQSISEIEVTQKQLKEAKEMINEKGSHIRELMYTTDTLKEAKEIINEKENHIRELIYTTDTLNKKIDELSAQAGACKSKMGEYDTQLKKADATINASENKSKMLNEEISSLQMELSRLTEILDSEKNDREGMQQRSNSVSERNGNLILENKELKLKLEETEKECRSQKEELTSALSSLDEMMKYIETSRKEHDDIIQSLEDDLSKALDVKHATENQMNEFVEEMRTECDSMKEKVITQAESSLVEYRRKIVELETSMNEKTSEVISLEHKVQILAEEVDQNQASARRSHNSNHREEYEEKLEETVEKLRMAEKENAELKESLTEARMRVCHDVEHKEQGEKIARLDASLKEKAAEATTLQDKIKALQAEVQRLSQILTDEKESNESERIRQREEYEIKVKDERQITLTKLSAAEKENAELKKSLEELRRKESQLVELEETVQQKIKNEIQLRGELAHKKQQMTIAESNEKHLQEHVASLEAQIDELISDYEKKLEEMSESSL